MLDRLNYSDETLTAEQTLNKNAGNCVSLTYLTTAYADLVDVDVSYDLMDSNLNFSYQQDFVVSADHLRTVLKDQIRKKDPADSFNTRKVLRIDYFPTAALNYVQGMNADLHASLYYSNHAAEAVANKRYRRALLYAKKALEISSDNSSALNVLALAHRHLGDQQRAEELFLYGIEHMRNKPTFLRNYSSLLYSQGRSSEALTVKQQLATLALDSPWQWINEGRAAQAQQNFDDAIVFYKKALNMAPELDRVHLHLAQSYSQLNKTSSARRHLLKAAEYAQTASIRGKYKSKLSSLLNY